MKSLRIIVPNRPGLLAEIAEILAARAINVDNLNVETHGEGALVRLEVEETDKALTALGEAGYKAVSDAVLLARIEDRPGAIATLSRQLADANINIRSVHHVRRDSGYAVVAISTDSDDRARDLLRAVVL